MLPEVLVVTAAVLVVSLATTGLVRRGALRHGLLDVPNARSSHTRPTPRGGGIAIVLTAVLGWTALYLWGALPLHLYLVAAGGGLAIALIGYLDDLYQVPSKWRLCMHFAAAAWAIFQLGAVTLPVTGNGVVDLWIGRILTSLGIVWALNLFNFMDGIDGLAAAEAAFMSAAGAALSVIAGAAWGVQGLAPVLAAASLGFLWWNWPPARIFMGDVGSGFLGYSIAVLALQAASSAPQALPVWLILGGYFFVDATLTLARRVLRRERFDEAHRTHAYQWLARRWKGHRPVTLAVAGLNLLLLVPVASLAVILRNWAWPLCAVALTVLTAICLAVGAGRREV